jgi:outer membrane protein assembly factor BamA
MRFYHFFIGFFVFNCATLAWSQSDTLREKIDFLPSSAATLKITKISISGNRRTKAKTILREMKTQVGDTLDLATLQADQQRIFNLGLFNRVEVDSLQRPDGVHVLIGVTERLYFFPYPILFLNERDWNKVSYGAGLVHTNFRGRREVMAISGWAGYNPAIAINYSNPWLLGSAQLLTGLSFSAQRVRSRSLDSTLHDVDERRIGGAWSIGRRFGLFTYLSAIFGYTDLQYDPPVPGKTLNPSGHDQLPSVGLAFTYDTRDLYEYPRSGVRVQLWARRTGFNSEYIHYLRYGADLRGYKKVYRGLSLGGRIMTDFSQSDIPIYDRVFLGYANRVRGHFYRKDEGENLALANVELRFPILPWRYFSISNVPMFGPYMQNMKFGISAGIFADIGQVWYQGQSPDFATSRRGFGAGLHIHLPYINLLRLEWAFNEDGKGEGIIDWNVSF